MSHAGKKLEPGTYPLGLLFRVNKMGYSHGEKAFGEGYYYETADSRDHRAPYNPVNFCEVERNQTTGALEIYRVRIVWKFGGDWGEIGEYFNLIAVEDAEFV